MRMTSAFALGLLAPVAVSAVVGTPALAQKSKKAEAPKPQYSKEFIAAAGDAQKAANAKDYAALAPAIEKASPAATAPDDKFTLNYFRYQLAAGTNNTALMKEAVAGMLDSGKAPAELQGSLHIMSGQFALQAGDATKAIGHLEAADAAGALGPDSRYLLAEALFSEAVKVGGGRITPQAQPLFAKGLSQLDGAIEGTKTAGKPVPANWYARGAEIGRAVGSSAATKYALAGVQNGGSPQAWGVLLSGFQSSHPDLSRSENLDVMRLMSVTKSLTSAQQYAEYVDAASKSGLVGEVKAMIDRGRAAGVLTPANLSDYYAQAEGQVATDRAGLAASEKRAASAPNGRAAAATGDAYLGYGMHAKAAEMYRLALQKGGVDNDEINTRLGISLAQSGDAEGAKAAFGAVTTSPVRKQIAEYWMTWLNTKAAA